jgi:hypothetical protein
MPYQAANFNKFTIGEQIGKDGNPCNLIRLRSFSDNGKSSRAKTDAGRDTWRQTRYRIELSNDSHEGRRV